MAAVELRATDPSLQRVTGPPALISGINLKPSMLPAPRAVVTVMVPDAPVPTTTSILDDEMTLKESAGNPPNSTDVAPVNPVPVIVIVFP